MGLLTVASPGLYTLVVDHGRPRTRSLGVPVGGAADRFELAIGNALVGNPPDAPALEVCLVGPTLRADCPLACVVRGAPFAVTIDGQSVSPGTTFTLPPHANLRIGPTPEGVRAYLCVRGGLDAPEVLGSRSALGPLRGGEVLACQPGTIAARSIRRDFAWNVEPAVLRMLPGAQAGWFDLAAFCHQTFEVTPASNRMGLRLRGEPLVVPPRELVSEPVCPGTVQVTRDGQCIVLGVDGQTIGGYPKIAQVIAADVDKMAQLRPGREVHLRPVTLGEAEAIARDKAAELREWLTRLRVSCP